MNESQRKMIPVHGTAALIWFALTLMTTLLALVYADSPYLVVWIIFMLGYANVIGHWSAKQVAEQSSVVRACPCACKVDVDVEKEPSIEEQIRSRILGGA